jgi:aryl-alcohol dehydrogenase-like predicted oxidoreductase
MSDFNATSSGVFTIGGDVPVHRLGFGAMRLTGKGVWGEPEDRAACLEVLRRLPALGVNFIDTADSYGPEISEDLIRAALHPYDGLLVATKGGLTRHGPGIWAPLGRPEYLRQCVLMSLRRLGLERIGLWQLHCIDPKTPRDEQLEVVRDMQKEGLIQHVGLSNVTIDDIEAARALFPVVTVQNRYNLVDRGSEDVLDYCEAKGIGFIPWFPLAAGGLAKPGSVLDRVAQAHGVGPSQIALAWVLKRSPVMLPIPGTASAAHLEENVAAANIELSEEDFRTLDLLGKKEWEKRAA